jgi:hypothetical protein
MDYASYVSGISFRFLNPDTAPGKDGWYDISNTCLPCDERAMRHRLRQICNIPRMSTFAIGAMINYGVAQMPDAQAFVNVGVWHGFTFMCGIVGNPRKVCIGIDNFTQFGGPREAFIGRFRKYRSANNRFFDMDYREYFSKVHTEPIGFYVYDGDHSYDNQLMGLQAAEPFFAKGCVILVDDTNWLEPRSATLDFISKSPYEYRILLDTTTCCNSHPTFWNGIMILRRTIRTRRRPINASTRSHRPSHKAIKVARSCRSRGR